MTIMCFVLKGINLDSSLHDQLEDVFTKLTLKASCSYQEPQACKGRLILADFVAVLLAEQF